MTTENIGEIVIAPRVLEVITGIAATKVEGVYALQNKNVTDSLSKTSLGRGVYLRTEEDGTVNADIYVSLQYGVNVPAVSIEFKRLLKQLSMIWQKWQFQKSMFTLNLLLLKSHQNQTWLNCLTRIF